MYPITPRAQFSRGDLKRFKPSGEWDIFAAEGRKISAPREPALLRRPEPVTLGTHSMDRRHLIAGVGAALAALGAFFLTRVDPDQAAIEAFASCFTGELTPEKVERALAYVDTTAASLEVAAYGEEHAYGPSDAQEVRERAHTAARSLRGTPRRALQKRIEVHPPRASLWMRLVSDDGMTEASFTFRKVGARWLVDSARFH